MVKGISILFFISTLFLIDLQCQIRGYILDSDTGNPVSEATISCNDIFSISDSTGYFIIDANPKDTLFFNHVAYQFFYLILEKRNEELEVNLIPKQNHIDQVIVKAPFFQHKAVQAPTSFSLIQKKEIEFGNDMDYSEILNLVPGIHVHSGSPGTKRITIRGIGTRNPYGTNRIKAYLNNIPITSADGTTNIEDLELSIVNRIEIIKGAKSALHNSGLGGIIHLKTPEQFKRGLHGKINSNLGSFGTSRISGYLSYAKKNINVAGYISSLKSDGYRANSSYSKKNALFTCQIKDFKKHKLRFLFYFTNGKSFTPSSLDYETYQNNPENAALNWLNIKGYEKYLKTIFGLDYQFQLSKTLSIHHSLYSNIIDSFESRPFNILDDNSLRKGVKSYLKYNSNQINMQVGVDIMDDKYEWEIFQTNAGVIGQLQKKYKETRRNLNTFLHVNYTISEKLFLESGLNINKISYKLKDLFPDSLDLSGQFVFKNTLSPFIGINYQSNSFFLLYSSISHGFSPPTLQETLLPRGQLNPDLKPETGINTDFGIRLLPFQSKLYADINFYMIWVKNLLVTKRLSEELFIGHNAGKSFHRGIEVTSYFYINENYNKKLPSLLMRGTINLSTSLFKSFIDEGIDYSENHLPGIPGQIFTFNTAIHLPIGLYLNTTLHYLSPQYLNDANNLKTAPYYLLNLKLGYNKYIYNNNLRLNAYVGIDNLSDTHFASMILINAPEFGNNAPRYYYPGKPRNMYLGVSLNF